MTEFLIDYGLFVSKALTLTLLIAGLLILLIAQAGKSAIPHRRERLEVRKLNDKYDEVKMVMNQEILNKQDLKKYHKEEKQRNKKETSATTPRPRIFVLTFDGDIKASAVQNLREEISAVLSVATAEDEVFLRLDSSGGLVHSYGLASSQLIRFRQNDIPLTIAVDKVAASGGYMMACTANRIVAAPFAILGSIGVLAQLPNFNRLLKKHDIDFEQFMAGEYKRTVTVFGENSDSGREKFQEDINETHKLFKTFVAENRPQLDIDEVATGEIWYGSQALEKKLVDELKTSDDYLFERSQNTDLYEVNYHEKKGLPHRVGKFMSTLADRMAGLWTNRTLKDQLHK